MDVLGLTLKLYLTLTVTLDSFSDNPTPKLECTGEGAQSAPLNPYKNLITRVALYVLRCHSINHFPHGLHIHCHNEIPFGRGLGSSGAAVIAGVLLADQIGNLKLDHSRQLDFALMVERHPDNVAAALLGGFVGSYLKELSPEDTSATEIPLSEVLPEIPEGAEREEWGMNPPIPPKGIGHWLQFGWADEVKAIVCIPDFEVPTAKAREVMPKSYNIKDVRIVVLTNALARSPPDSDLIFQAMQDRIHQPYRSSLVSMTFQQQFSMEILIFCSKQIPALPRILQSFSPTSHSGLLGVCLSGAGPTILALATGNFDTIGKEIEQIFVEEGGVKCRWQVLDIDTQGSRVEEL
ncbi:Trihydroxynaphthalene reductase [Cystobasidiomycetes sp. EMM_F5]